MIGVREDKRLVAVKVVHTAVWAFFVLCIAGIPVVSLMRRFTYGGVLTGFVLVECVVLAANRGRCPLTDLAARYRNERASNFDIYLPLWRAQHNKAVFGGLFAANLVLLAWQFWR